MNGIGTETAKTSGAVADRRARMVAAGCAASALVITVLVFIGYATHNPRLASFIENGVAMRPNAALSAVLCGVAVLLLVSGGARARRAAQVLGAMVLVIAALTACEYLLGVNVGIDELFFHAFVPNQNGQSARMSHLAIFEFLLLSCALLLLARAEISNASAGQVLAAIVSSTGLLETLGYSFHAEAFYSAGLGTDISCPATLASLLLGCAIMLVRAQDGWMRVVLSSGAGGVMLRRLLPIAVAVPWVLAWLSVAGARAGLYDKDSDQVYFAAPLIVIMVIMLLRNAVLLDRVDRERGRQSEHVQELNRNLEDRVAARTRELASANAALQLEIQEHHRTERQLRQKEQELRDKQLYSRSLLESSIDALSAINPQGLITDVNQQMELLTGRSRQELIGTAFGDCFTDPERAEAGVRLVLQTGKVTDYELVARSRDGRETPVAYNAATFYNERHELLGVFAAARDITDRKRAEESLRRSEERYRSLAIATAQIVWTTDRDGQVVGEIPGWSAYTGMTTEEIQGGGWINAVHPEDRERTAAVWSKAVQERSFYQIEYRFRRRDGEYRHMIARGVPVLENKGNVREWIGTCTDITEQKLAAQELERAHAELEDKVRERTAELAATNKELEAFTYSVSHDLRAPLRHVDSFGQMLEDHIGRAADEQTVHYLKRIRTGAQRMSRLIEDLLNLSRVGR